jgi:hypothetical protein
LAGRRMSDLVTFMILRPAGMSHNCPPERAKKTLDNYNLCG